MVNVDPKNYTNKQRWNITICDNMDEALDYYAKWNKSEKDKNYDFTHMWNVKQKITNKLAKQKTNS